MVLSAVFPQAVPESANDNFAPLHAAAKDFATGYLKAAKEGVVDQTLVQRFCELGATEDWIKQYSHEPSLQEQHRMMKALLASLNASRNKPQP